jgi:ABC-type nitrate/sulfonate/bicarbonate transport system permease component
MAGINGAVRPPGTTDPFVRRPRWGTLTGGVATSLIVVEFALVFAVWQIAVGSFELVSPVFLPPPSDIAVGFMNLVESGELWLNTSASLVAWFGGFVLALVCGVALGIVLGAWVPAHRLLGPILWSFYAIPWLAYQPLSQAWFGFGLPPVIFLVFIATLFPILFNTAAGVSATELPLLNAGRVFGASRIATFRKIVLPASLPYLFAGMRQSVVMATTALLVAEMTGPSVGMGALIIFKTNRFATDEAFAVIMLTVVWTVALSELVAWAGRRLAPWQTDARQS